MISSPVFVKQPFSGSASVDGESDSVDKLWVNLPNNYSDTADNKRKLLRDGGRSTNAKGNWHYEKLLEESC